MYLKAIKIGIAASLGVHAFFATTAVISGIVKVLASRKEKKDAGLHKDSELEKPEEEH